MDLEKFKKKLLDKKAVLENRVETIHDHAKKALDADSAEQAAELGNVEVVSALESEAVAELASIEAALRRIQAGTYGICVSCGEVISEERLSVRPESLECVDCAELPQH